MKNCLLFSCVITFFILHVNNVMAQKVSKANSYDMLVGVDTLNYRFDFTDFAIDGQDPKSYFLLKDPKFADNPNEGLKIFYQKVEASFMWGIKKSKFGKSKRRLDNKNPQRFEIVILFDEVEEDGGHKAIVKLIDKENGKKQIAEIIDNECGGKFNQFINLFSEELQESGDAIGKKLSRLFDQANHTY